MQLLALLLVTAAGLWILAVAMLMAVRPADCLSLMTTMKQNLEHSNWRLQFTRVLAGLALIIRAPASKLPLLFGIAGWILVVTSLLIMAAPIRWHGAYGATLMKRLTPRLLRILSPIPAAAGAGLIYAAL
jgi:hypothetical protein